MVRRLLALVVLAAGTASTPHPAGAVAGDRADAVRSKIGVSRGICALLGDQEAKLAVDLARHTNLTIYVQLPTGEETEAAARAADAAGYYGTRIFVAQGNPARIGLADNLADAVVASAAVAAPKAEVLRVLRPDGKALVGQEDWVKPFPEGVDDWSHHYHSADNNPQSRDRLARGPYLTQFIVEPRYAPAPQMVVASQGRVFMAFGNIAWHQREEAWLNTLIALDGFNGTMLWKRPLSAGIMVDRSTMIATPTVLYLADEKSCKLLNAATGKLQREIAPPADLTGGTFWKWMALEDGVLYALIGPQEVPDTVSRWGSQGHGWPWSGISKGYNSSKPYHWGFAASLLAIEPSTGGVLWVHHEEPPIDSRSLCMKNGRIYFCSFGKYLACVDAKTGQAIWKRTAEKDPELFEAIGPYRPGHGFIEGWKSTVYLKCTDKALYFVGPEVEWLTALSADDGHVLWRYQVKNLQVLIRDDGLYTVGPQNSKNDVTKKLDPLTGNVLASYATRRRACTRVTGAADCILFRGHEGTARLDPAAGITQWFSTMRPSCHVGVVIANGHLYWAPWVCDCSLQMFGAISLGPAGNFAFDQKATEQQRRETTSGPAEVAHFHSSPKDWPTYRADPARSARSKATILDQVGTIWVLPGRPGIEPTAPVAAGGLVFVAGGDGIVRAVASATGQPRWKAYVGGVVRYPPTVADGRALVGSSDGWVYALEAATGRLLWRFRAAPAERRIPIYGALLSTWPVASGVLVDGGTAYFAAGITDYDGTHVYAVNAATGKIRWQNNIAGHLDPVSCRGVACQGELLLHDGKLYMPGGNSVGLATFDAATGQCLTPPPTGMGGSARRGRELNLVGETITVSGQPLYSKPGFPVFDQTNQWAPSVVYAKNAKLTVVDNTAANGPPWMLVARHLSGSGKLWSQPLPAEPVRWGVAVDAQGRVIVALRNGQVRCLGKML